jgi:hypothetical protein
MLLLCESDRRSIRHNETKESCFIRHWMPRGPHYSQKSALFARVCINLVSGLDETLKRFAEWAHSEHEVV